MAVTSIVRDRGRALGVVAALTASVALASAPTAIGAVDGDPINTSTDAFKVKLSGGFKKQLKSNGVKMKPKKLKLTKGDVDPTTGKADLTPRQDHLQEGQGEARLQQRQGLAARQPQGLERQAVQAHSRHGCSQRLRRRPQRHQGEVPQGRREEDQQEAGAELAAQGERGHDDALLPAADGEGDRRDSSSSTSPLVTCPSVLGPNTDPNTVAAKQPSHCIGPAGGVAVVPGDPNNPARLTTRSSR